MFFYSESESKRFKLNVHRGSGDASADTIKQYLVENAVDMLILRTPVERKDLAHDLFLLGFPTLHADNLVTYTADLQKIEIAPSKNNIVFEEVNAQNMHEIREMIPTIFAQYQNHYSSNHFIKRQDILDGYIEWASSSLNKTEGNVGWIAKLNGQKIGFATCSFNKKTLTSEGVLYGILPEHGKSGFYTDLFRHSMRYFKEFQFQTFTIPTQIQNFSVQKVWVREGLKLTSASDTYHVNAFLQSDSKSKTTAHSLEELSSVITDYVAKNIAGHAIQNSSMVVLNAPTSSETFEVSYRLLTQNPGTKTKLLITQVFEMNKPTAIFYHILTI